MALATISRRVVQKGIDQLSEFNLDNLSGKKIRKGEKVDLGRLPRKEAHSIDKAVYVIYSYNTPIAWALSKDAWIIPKVRYSTTTTQHQNIIQTAVDNPGFYL